MTVEIAVKALVLFAWFVIAFVAGRIYEVVKHEEDVLDWAAAFEATSKTLKALVETLEEYERRYGKL